jgi:NADH:ubiquinone oxidoreductase subunit E
MADVDFREDFREFAENAIAEELPEKNLRNKTEEELLAMLKAVQEMKSIYETNNNSSPYSAYWKNASSDRVPPNEDEFSMRLPQDYPLRRK